MATPIPSNEAAFSLSEITSATGGRVAVRAAGGQGVVGVSTDSRQNLRGNLFVALRGESFDGHRFLSQAVQAGASALLIEDTAESQEFLKAEDAAITVSKPLEVSVILVSDTLSALGELARHHRQRWQGKLLAVAGSAGKTTTRSVISTLLDSARQGRVHSTLGNLNNRIGVPMVLLGLKASHHYAVVELGTNCPGEIEVLTRMARPDLAILTLIDLEHTEGLGDLDGVEKEEFQAFSHFGPEGIAVGFGEDIRVARCLESSGALRRLSYGFSVERDLQIVERVVRGPKDFENTFQRNTGDEFSVRSPLAGRPGALAVAAGILCVEAILGEELSVRSMQEALRSCGEPGRSTVVELLGERLVLDDSYNASPVSVESSIATGKELCAARGGRLWLVLGEMLELGSLSGAAHREMGQRAARSGAAGVFFVQGDARLAFEAAGEENGENLRYFESSAEVAAVLGPLLEPRDVVVVKASRGVRVERVVEGLAAAIGLEIDADESARPMLPQDEGNQL